MLGPKRSTKILHSEGSTPNTLIKGIISAACCLSKLKLERKSPDHLEISTETLSSRVFVLELLLSFKKLWWALDIHTCYTFNGSRRSNRHRRGSGWMVADFRYNENRWRNRGHLPRKNVLDLTPKSSLFCWVSDSFWTEYLTNINYRKHGKPAWIRHCVTVSNNTNNNLPGLSPVYWDKEGESFELHTNH